MLLLDVGCPFRAHLVERPQLQLEARRLLRKLHVNRVQLRLVLLHHRDFRVHRVQLRPDVVVARRQRVRRCLVLHGVELAHRVLDALRHLGLSVHRAVLQGFHVLVLCLGLGEAIRDTLLEVLNLLIERHDVDHLGVQSFHSLLQLRHHPSLLRLELALLALLLHQAPLRIADHCQHLRETLPVVSEVLLRRRHLGLEPPAVPRQPRVEIVG
mmetsp:Transcript_55225/g.131180  ORF Transcript_55225/g.131180 Transcript_55225/m.131180 type:complete len:212 (-) Transcript_55225:1023-1658(-)